MNCAFYFTVCIVTACQLLSDIAFEKAKQALKHLTKMQSLNSQARMGQVLDDEDHKRCSQGNQRGKSIILCDAGVFMVGGKNKWTQYDLFFFHSSLG